MVRSIGYARKLLADEELPPELFEWYRDHALVACRGAPLEGRQPLGRLGDLSLYLVHRDDALPLRERRGVIVEPVLCRRRGVSAEEVVGIDDEVCTPDFLPDPAAPAPLRARRPRRIAAAVASSRRQPQPRGQSGG